ncbi:hypothetical protein AOXY_G2405 [Acipenser oxyrinchus oxyrinchus]|uniref:Uncharacterized protein n=1 Tax=Acipenser oxyrinchus oxyrinchus TaxID=40147 RepID=A0AAD8LTR8_ACIOX|nr:hypothetical protein AOXY_G2405 [Acipenser oxyrinchus oxyrinchus]
MTAPDDLPVEEKQSHRVTRTSRGIQRTDLECTALSTLRPCEPYRAPKYWTLASCSNFTTEYYTLQYIKEKYCFYLFEEDNLDISLESVTHSSKCSTEISQQDNEDSLQFVASSSKQNTGKNQRKRPPYAHP